MKKKNDSYESQSGQSELRQSGRPPRTESGRTTEYSEDAEDDREYRRNRRPAPRDEDLGEERRRRRPAEDAPSEKTMPRRSRMRDEYPEEERRPRRDRSGEEYPQEPRRSRYVSDEDRKTAEEETNEETSSGRSSGNGRKRSLPLDMLPPVPDAPEEIAYAEYLEKKEEKTEKNRLKNRPIIFLTYAFVILFLGMFGFLIYFLAHDAARVIADNGNRRQDAMATSVVRGDIRTADGVVLAKTDSVNGEDTRSYPQGEMYAHVVGFNSYGKSGLELSMNFQLLTTHESVAQQVKDDLAGRKKPGDSVITTLDSKLQAAAYKALGNNKGAVVVMEPDTGKILAMVSKPGFDPNKIDEVWDEIHTEEGAKSSVLVNRATRGLYAPGSTFKVVTALEYLREHPGETDYSYKCTGEDSFNGVKIICYNHKAHGTVDLEHSIGYSCNTSFANIGMNLITMDGLKKTAEDLLFNQELPYDNGSAASSFTMDNTKSREYIPQTVIGQGETQITPLHNALIMASIANGGVMMKPYIVDRIVNVNGEVVTQNSTSVAKTVMTAEEAGKLQELLLAPGAYGTAAWKFKNYRHKIVGKTGTAEYDEAGHCNSWFVGYSNPDDPDIVVSVVIEDSDSNGLTGVQVAGAVFETYYP